VIVIAKRVAADWLQRRFTPRRPAWFSSGQKLG
jgi:hypothetical protein